jgi:hypothetical protein
MSLLEHKRQATGSLLPRPLTLSCRLRWVGGISQVQFSLLDRRPLNGMLQYCQQRGIKLMTYGSVAGGLLSDKYVEEPKKGLFGEQQLYGCCFLLHDGMILPARQIKMYAEAGGVV